MYSQYILKLPQLVGLALFLIMPVYAKVPQVPPGFEDLVAGQVEQLEVQLLGRSLGLFSTWVTPDTVTFEAPDTVFAAIGIDATLPEAEQQQLREALSQPLSRNGHLACHGQSRTGCGYLQTDTVAVIFEESEGQLSLHLNKAWLPQKSHLDSLWFTLTPKAHNALIHQQSLNFDVDRRYRHLTMTGSGALGLGEKNHMAIDWSLNTTQTPLARSTRFFIHNLYYRHEIGRTHYVQIGRMDQGYLSSLLGGTFSFSMLPLGKIEGLRFGTTQAWVDPKQQAKRETSPVLVLLTRAARVVVYRDSQLLGTFYLQAGMNTLDTSGFPEGSYPIALHIYENGVLNRIESAHVTRIGGPSLPGGFQWFIQGGRALKAGHRFSNDGFSSQAGFKTRLPYNLTLNSGVAALPGRHWYHETRLDWRHVFSLGTLSTSYAALLGNDGVRGNSQSLNFNHGISWSLYRYDRSSPACHRGGHTVHYAIGCTRSLTATVSFPVGKWYLSTGYTNSLSQSFSHASSHPIAFSARVSTLNASISRTFLLKKMYSHLRLGISQQRPQHGQRDITAYLSLDLSGIEQVLTARRPSFSTSAGMTVNGGNNGKATQTDYSVNGYWFGDKHGVQRKLLVELKGTQDQLSSARLDGSLLGGRYGNLHATLVNTWRHGQYHPFLSGRYSSSFALSPQGVFIGPASWSASPAGLAITVPGKPTPEPAAEVVSSAMNRPVTLGFGKRLFVPLNGFKPSTVEVRDVSSAQAKVTTQVKNSGQRQYFLTPGKLLTHSVEADVTYTLVGRLVNAAGQALGQARVLNAPATSQEDGSFILELKDHPEQLYILFKDHVMHCPIQIRARRHIVMIVGETICEPVGIDTLPAELLKRPFVQRYLRNTQQLAQKTTQ